MELNEAIQAHAGGQRQALERFLRDAEIASWSDCTRTRLLSFRDLLNERVAPNSAKTYAATFAAILGRYRDEKPICQDYAECLRIRGEKPLKTYLTEKELERLEKVACLTETERFVRAAFLISARTGCRISDALRLTDCNIVDGVLTYVSQKTSIRASVPCGERVAELIKYVNDHRADEPSLAGYNKAIRRLCERAEINEPTQVYKAGRTAFEPKWHFISSHTGRISFATNLAKLKVPTRDLSRLMGHSNEAQTERYIVPTEVKLDPLAMSYFH